MQKKNRVGERFGRLVVIAAAPNGKFGKTRWECRCDCGAVRVFNIEPLVSGATRSCGCLRIETMRKIATTHGATRKKSPTREYQAWCKMKERCGNPNIERFPNYGGRGIGACDKWIDDFDAFLRDMGECPRGCTLERKNVNKGYCKENCCWLPRPLQARNKTNTVWVEWGGEKIALCELEERLGTGRRIYHFHIVKKWPLEKAVRRAQSPKMKRIPNFK